MEKIALSALKLIAAIAVIWALIHHGTLDLGSLRLAASHPSMLALVVALLMMTYFMTAFRWHVLLKCQNIDITVNSAIRLTFFTLFVSTFLPGGLVGGDTVRVAYVAKRLSSKRTSAVLSIFIDRFLGLYAMLLAVCVVALLDLPGITRSVPLQFLAIVAATLSVAIPAIFWVLYVALQSTTPRLRHFAKLLPGGLCTEVFRKLVEGIRHYRHAPTSIAIALGISVLVFTLGIICVMILGYSMHLGPLTSLDYGFAAPWAWLANLLPITPGGLGVGEAAFDRICHWREVSPTTAAYGTIFLVYRIANIVATLPGLAIYLFRSDIFKISSQ